MAVGKNAKAGLRSIAIGANTGAGSEVFLLLNQLKEILEKNDKSSKDVINLIIELQKPNPDKTMVQKLWSIIKSAAAINGAIGLIRKIDSLLF